MAIQMLKNKDKSREEIKPLDKERQKLEMEKSLESIRRFNQINEERKVSHDKQVTKLKQQEEDMRESLRKVEAKHYPDLDQTKDRESSKDLDQSKNSHSDRESSSSDDFVYVQKPKTNKFKCEACNQELAQKNYYRHNQSRKPKKDERLYNRNKVFESANEDGIKVTNEDIEQKINNRYLELEGIKDCDSCDMYLDNNTEHAKNMDTLKHRNNVRLVNGEIIKNGSKFECVICKTTLSQYSLDQHLKTKMHLDNVNPRSGFLGGKDKHITEDPRSGYTNSTISKDNSGYCNICNTGYNNKNENNESDEHKEKVKQKKLVDKWRKLVDKKKISGEIKLMSWD